MAPPVATRERATLRRVIADTTCYAVRVSPEPGTREGQRVMVGVHVIWDVLLLVIVVGVVFIAVKLISAVVRKLS